MMASPKRWPVCGSQARTAFSAPGTCETPGHVPIIDPYARGRKVTWAETDRYRERTLVERMNGRLKDEFGADSSEFAAPRK
jgi:hypothetical protein